MQPGFRYPSGIVFVRQLTSFEDAVFEHERGAKLCLHLGESPVGRVVNFFYIPDESTRAVFADIAKRNRWFVAGMPVT